MSEAMKPCPVADELERRAENCTRIAEVPTFTESAAMFSAATAFREAAALVRQSSPATAREVEELRAEADEMHDIGHRDGYETAVQDIDLMTGGDGEYFASTIPGDGCPDAATMKAGIARRFAELRAEVERLREAGKNDWVPLSQDDAENELFDCLRAMPLPCDDKLLIAELRERGLWVYARPGWSADDDLASKGEAA